jgi:very-short-patch-repair endonuclease
MRGMLGRGPTDIERIMGRALRDAKVKYVEQQRVGPYYADFYLPELNVIVEVDGEYWHRGREDKDAQRDAYMARCGYRVFRFGGEFVKSNAAGCVRRVTQ